MSNRGIARKTWTGVATYAVGLDKLASTRSAYQFLANYLALAGFREATKTPASTSAKPMMWNSLGCSPRKTMAMADPNTGTT